jgi:hypothetical protein
MNLGFLTDQLLFNGYEEEAETLFGLSNELQKDKNLCENMIILTRNGLLSRYVIKGQYKTVESLLEFYKEQASIHGTGGELMEALNNYKEGGCLVDYEDHSPIYHALLNERYDIYKLLRKNMDLFTFCLSIYCSLPELLGEIIGPVSYEGVMLVLDEVTPEMCSPSDIKSIENRLFSVYQDWYIDSQLIHCISENFWTDESYNVAVKLKIKPSQYMLKENSYGLCHMCKGYGVREDCSVRGCDIFRKRFTKHHIDGYIRIMKERGVDFSI